LTQALEFKPAHASAQVATQTPAPVPPLAPLKSGTQLSLIPPPEPPADNEARGAPVEETPESLSPEPATTPPSATFALQAPMRLNPVVRDVLAEAVRTLNDGMGPPTVCTVAQGVFVPLEEFGRRGVQPSLAMRALTEANLLMKPNRNGPPTLSREFNGNPTLGIVLNPRCVSGLDLAGFAAPPAEGS
jgi:conjugal transfer pilus assembly protein TraI